MGTCLTKQQYTEAVRKESLRLLDLESQGYDIAEAMETLKANEKAFNEERFKDLQVTTNTIQPLNPAIVSRANREAPRRKTANNKTQKIERINSLFVDQDGTYKANVVFPNNEKEYTINAYELSLDQMDIMDAIEFELDTLGSTPGAKKATKDVMFDIEKDIHKNPKRIRQLLEEINKMEGQKESTEHMEHLRDIVRKFDTQFLNKLNFHLNTEAEKTLGVLDNSDLKIVLSTASKLAGNEQTAAETYVHELVHAYTAFGLNSKTTEARRIDRELRSIIDIAMDNLKWQDFLPKTSIDKALEEKNAREMYDYIFKSEHYVDEFLAHALTNPIVMNKLKHVKISDTKQNTTLLEKVKNLFSSLIDIVLGKYEFNMRNTDVYNATLKLAIELSEINNKAINQQKNSVNPVTRLTEWFDANERLLSDKLQRTIKDLTESNNIPDFPGFEDKVKYALWVVKYMPKLIFDKRLRPVLKAVLASLGMKEEGFVQNVLRDFWESDELQDEITLLELAQGNNETARLNTISAVKGNLLSEFKERPTADEERAMSRVLIDTDISSIAGKYTNAELVKILSDEAELNKRLSRAKHDLRQFDNKNYNWHVNQANGLGYYMATHNGNIAQNLNTVNIARGVMSDHRKSPSKTLVSILDEVAVLTAIKYSQPKDKRIVAELMKNERKGVQNIISTHKGFTDLSKKAVFSDSTTHYIQGYSKEIFDNRFTLEVAKVSDHAKMRSKGFELVETFENDPITRAEPMALYKASSFETREYNRGAVSLTNLNRKGTTFSEVRFKEGDSLAKRKAMIDKQKIDTERRKLVNKMLKGEVELGNVQMGIVPLLNEQGNVIDYRYTMDKNAKEKHLGQDVAVSEVLSRSIANVHDKVSSKEQNEKVLDLIKADMKENYNGTLVGNNGEAYVKIGPNSTDKYIQELYKILPNTFTEAIKDSKGGYLAVRKDMLLNYFGYRHFGIADTWLAKITPDVIMKFVKWAEFFWQEIIRISKVSTLIRTPIVIIENIVSNAMYAIWTGTSPIELLNMYKESTRDVKDYLAKHKEVVRLENVRLGRKLKYAESVKLDKLNQDLKKNPVHELMEAGIYQAIVEDISTSELKSTNRISRYIDEKTENIPEVVKQGAHWLYLSEKTGYYKFMSEVLQLSDLIARDVENRKKAKLERKQADGQMALPLWWMQEKFGDNRKPIRKKLTGTERKEFLEKAAKRRKLGILQAFVNYNKPSTSLEEYANRMGLVMFTKYMKRIQNVIANTTLQHPLRGLMFILFQALLIDVETIQDQQLLVRSYQNLDQSFIEHLTKVGMPSMVRLYQDGIV